MSRLTPEGVSNLHGVLRIGLEARNAPKEVAEAADLLFFELARRAGFPLLKCDDPRPCDGRCKKLCLMPGFDLTMRVGCKDQREAEAIAVIVGEAADVALPDDYYATTPALAALCCQTLKADFIANGETGSPARNGVRA